LAEVKEAYGKTWTLNLKWHFNPEFFSSPWGKHLHYLTQY
jgi:hypothetical protein